MTEAMAVAVLSCVGTLVGSIAGIMTANRLTSFRIAQLEGKMDHLGALVERVTIVEQSTKSAHIRLDDIARKEGKACKTGY